MTNNINNLLWLINELGYKVEDIKGDSPINFENRVKLQKIVYILEKFFGNEIFDYEYNVYLRGPYSKDLAKDYFEITEEDLNKKVELKYGNVEKVREIIKKLKNIESFELEIMATLLSIRERNNLNDAIELTYNLKSNRLEENGKNINFIKTDVINKLRVIGFTL